MAAEATLDSDAEQHRPLGGLLAGEEWWRDHYTWLKEAGYTLRRRYHPDWIPSWTHSKSQDPFAFEDGQWIRNTFVLDAVKVPDGSHVCLKRIRLMETPSEADIATYLASDALRRNPHNHCVPIIEILRPSDDKDSVIIVMPLLRDFYSPEFDTFGEVVGFIKQIFEGLKFIHDNHIVHRDCKYDNIVMDASAMYPKGWHPIKIQKSYDFKGHAQCVCTRTQCSKPPKYYFIDYGIAKSFEPSENSPTAIPIISGDRTAPELQGEGQKKPYNPFPTDVYYVGNLIRIQFLKGDNRCFHPKFGFEWLEPLIKDMTQDDPLKRPTMAEAVVRFDELVESLSSWKLRSMVISKRESWLRLSFRLAAHWRRRIVFIIKRTPAIPTPE